MDIDLLSKMVKELILDRDRVVLPGLGTFTAEMMPATFSDKGFTINPPYRRLYFRSKAEDDTVLAEFYSSSNDVSLEVAERILADFLTELKQILREKKTVIFPGLGRLRATRENNFFFVPDEDLDIYPEGFGLAPISLKTHQETREELTAAVSELRSIMDGDESQSPVEPVPSGPDLPSESSTPSEPDTLSEPDTHAGPDTPAEPDTHAEPDAPVEPDATAAPDTTAGQMEPSALAEPAAGLPRQDGQPDLASATPADGDGQKAGKTGTRTRLAVKIAAGVISALVILVLLYIILNHIFPGIFDGILYSREQLEILDYTAG